MSELPDKSPLSPTELPLGDAVKILAALGNRDLSVSQIERDIEAGAPVNTDGTLNLIRYAAWLANERRAHAD